MNQHLTILLLAVASAYALPGQVPADAPVQTANIVADPSIVALQDPPVIADPKIPVVPVVVNVTTSTAVPTPEPQDPSTTSSTQKTTVVPVVPDVPDVPPFAPQVLPDADFAVKELGVACVLANITIELKVTYHNEKDNSNPELTYEYNRDTATVDKTSSCGVKANFLNLKPIKTKWAPLLRMSFAEVDGRNWALNNIKFDFVANGVVFPGLDPVAYSTYFVENGNLTYWKTPKGHAFSCQNGVDSLNFDLKTVNGTLVNAKKLKLDMDLKKVVVQALMTRDDGNKFGDVNVCAADQRTSELIPILIGVALVVLVLVVLIAYIIGRRRARARGYESM